jgi:hypothetical protein
MKILAISGTLTPDAPDDHLRHEIASVHEEYVLLGHAHSR